MKNEEEREDIWTCFDKMRWSVKLGKNAGRADQMFYKSLQEGRKNNDLDKIYEFIEASERGTALKTDWEVCKLFQKAYKENPGRLCRILAEKNDIADYWRYLSACCETDMIVTFAGMDVPYPCFYYECARLLMKQIKNGSRYEELKQKEQRKRCEDGVIAAAQKLAAMDPELWERWLRKNEKNPDWQKLLFRVLSGVSMQSLKIFVKIMDLDRSTQQYDHDILAQGFSSLPSDSQNYILEGIGNDLLERWNDFFEEAKKSGKFVSELFYSGYFHLIINALGYVHGEKDKWRSLFLKYSQTLEEDMYDWYESESRMSSIFFLDMEQVYYAFIAGKEYHLTENDESGLFILMWG